MARKYAPHTLDLGIDEKWYSGGYRGNDVKGNKSLVMRLATITHPEFGAWGDGLVPVKENLSCFMMECLEILALTILVIFMSCLAEPKQELFLV